jgi:hypothetical protein
VYNHTLPTAKHQIQQAETTSPTVALGVEASRVDNALLLDYLTFEVALENHTI